MRRLSTVHGRGRQILQTDSGLHKTVCPKLDEQEDKRKLIATVIL